MPMLLSHRIVLLCRLTGVSYLINVLVLYSTCLRSLASSVAPQLLCSGHAGAVYSFLTIEMFRK